MDGGEFIIHALFALLRANDKGIVNIFKHCAFTQALHPFFNLIGHFLWSQLRWHRKHFHFIFHFMGENHGVF